MNGKITRIRRMPALVVFWRSDKQHTYALTNEKAERRVEQVIGALIVGGDCHVRKGSTRLSCDIRVTKNIQKGGAR